MWFATGDGLNRYDGNTVVVYKHNPKDPGTISDNFIRDLTEDDHGYLWVAAYPGVNRFDSRTERSTRYRRGGTSQRVPPRACRAGRGRDPLPRQGIPIAFS
jgi:ligand-binding sensor domain-containing protein